MNRSEAKSAAESGSFNIVVDVFLVNGVFDNFSGAERNVSGWVEVSRSVVKGSFSGSPAFNFSDLNN